MNALFYSEPPSSGSDDNTSDDELIANENVASNADSPVERRMIKIKAEVCL